MYSFHWWFTWHIDQVAEKKIGLLTCPEEELDFWTLLSPLRRAEVTIQQAAADIYKSRRVV